MLKLSKKIFTKTYEGKKIFFQFCLAYGIDTDFITIRYYKKYGFSKIRSCAGVANTTKRSVHPHDLFLVFFSYSKSP